LHQTLFFNNTLYLKDYKKYKKPKMEQMELDINGNPIPTGGLKLKDVASEEELFVDCPYKIGGCTEKLERDTEEMKEHIGACEFRPIPCLMPDCCSEPVPYQNFLLHQMQHFLQPQFSASITTTMVLEQEDFNRDRRWSPRWINCYDKDFFFMVSHRVPDMWHFWMWILGSQDEADQYYYDIEVCKGENKKSGTYSVLSIRTPTESIEKQEIAMSMTGYQVKRLSKIGDNLYGSFDIDLVIYKLKNPTGRLHLADREE